MKYRKKPVVVDAEQFFPDKKPWPEGVEQYTKEMHRPSADAAESTWFGWYYVLIDRERVPVVPGWWVVVSEEDGTTDVLTPDIFAAIYEPAEDGA